MSIETDLKKEGIIVTKTLDTLTINSIAKKVSELLCKNFPEQNLEQTNLFISIARLHMYMAKMPSGTAVAKYYYKNSSIYFNEKIDIENIENYAIHECIHYIQERKDDNGELIKLGLCDFKCSHLPGMALNEAAVQLMTSKCLNQDIDTVKYFGITLPTTSPGYYPLECNLVNQMAYIVSDNILFHSTLYGDDIFKSTFISLTSKKAYNKVQSNIDELIILEDNLSSLNTNLETNEYSDKEIYKIGKQINSLKQQISGLFIETQNLIITSYFDTYYNNLHCAKDIENYRNKLYNFKNIIGVTDNYNFFNEYYINKMADLEIKYNEIENIYTTLAIVKTTKFSLLLSKIRKFFSRKQYDDVKE